MYRTIVQKKGCLKSFLHQDFRLAYARSRKPRKLLFEKNFGKTLKELKTTNKIMTNNSSDARHYKQNTGHSKQDNNKYQQKRFLVKRGRTFNPPKSTASQGKGASVSVLSLKELALKLTRLFVKTFEWTKVSDSQLIVNSLCAQTLKNTPQPTVNICF